MRIRTLLAFGVGTAAGAVVTWAWDPDHGTTRRRQARRWAATHGREQAAHAATAAVAAARSYTDAVRQGFEEAAGDAVRSDGRVPVAR